MVHDVLIQVHSHAIDVRAIETKPPQTGVMAGRAQQSHVRVIANGARQSHKKNRFFLRNGNTPSGHTR